MKKLALLLGALTLVSGAAYAKEVVPVVEEVAVVEEAPVAAPALRVTSVGQGIEIDNTSGGSNIGEQVFFKNYANLAYGDNWEFNLMASKIWDMDTDDGIHSKDHRIELGFWRHFDNVSLGFKWRGQEEFDRYYLRTKYNYGMFGGWIDFAYQSNNGATDKEDAYYVEAIPVQLTVGPLTMGYYFEADTWAVNDKENGFEHFYRQQLRLSAPIYQGEKLKVGLEYRWQFDTSNEYDQERANAYNKNVPFGWTEANSNTHIVVLSAAYNVTENLMIDGYYQYDMKDYDSKGDGEVSTDSDKYYGEFYIGWTYLF